MSNPFAIDTKTPYIINYTGGVSFGGRSEGVRGGAQTQVSTAGYNTSDGVGLAHRENDAVYYLQGQAGKEDGISTKFFIG